MTAETSPLRVLVDATALPANRGGVGRYVDELVAGLASSGIEVHIASQTRDEARYTALVGASRVHPMARRDTGVPRRLVWEQTGLARLAWQLKPQILLSPHYTMPLVAALPGGPLTVVTVHDATFFTHPEFHDRVKRHFFPAWTRIAARLADAVVVPSRATRDQVVEQVGADPARITVVPHGVDHSRFRPPTPTEVRAAREWAGVGPDAAYVAFLGTLEPRKNVPALIRAFVTACAERQSPPELVLAGATGWDTGIEAALAQVPDHLSVRRPGFLPDDLVAGYLGGATLVAYPSHGEGFGLPVLEAMACGAPVLTSPYLSLPEVGGDAVAYATSSADSDIARSLAGLLDDPGRRRELATRGRDRALTFTWERAATEHRALFEELVRHDR